MKILVHVLVVSLLVVNFTSAQNQVPASAIHVDRVKTNSAMDPVKPSNAVKGEPAAKLPVRRVVLYKNGVGYFEHLGRVHGSQYVHIDFTSAQLIRVF